MSPGAVELRPTYQDGVVSLELWSEGRSLAVLGFILRGRENGRNMWYLSSVDLHPGMPSSSGETSAELFPATEELLGKVYDPLTAAVLTSSALASLECAVETVRELVRETGPIGRDPERVSRANSRLVPLAEAVRC